MSVRSELRMYFKDKAVELGFDIARKGDLEIWLLILSA